MDALHDKQPSDPIVDVLKIKIVFMEGIYIVSISMGTQWNTHIGVHGDGQSTIYMVRYDVHIMCRHALQNQNATYM